MTRTLKSELVRVGLKEEKEKSTRFSDHAIEATYTGDMAEMSKTRLRHTIKPKRAFKNGKGGDVTMVKIHKKGINVDTAGFQILKSFYERPEGITTKDAMEVHSKIKSKTVSAYLTWMFKNGILEKFKEGPGKYKWALTTVSKSKPVELVYFDFLEAQKVKVKSNRKAKKEEKVQKEIKTAFQIGTEVKADDFQPFSKKESVKDFIETFKRLLEKGLTVNIKISFE